ncbi:CD109 [Mytilus coruscus]|uniref:CD109 n=1 Tax=Mytilus coruscus TaxID=42192 RepID=A0A6J8DDC6_MYTCO|nr:CD109 [Mytilus coruscus]
MDKEGAILNLYYQIVFVPKETVIPTKIGSTLLDASVRSTAAADAVQRPLLVKMSFIDLKPEGIRENYNIPVVIDLRRKTRFSTNVPITFPAFVIPDSEFIKISVIGDLIGTTLAGVEDLLRMSYGCGEQNLVRFVPNVFISVYLKVTNRLTNDIKDKVDRYLSAGYQRQLSYARFDGSFSAFGNSDRYGSTWLTAFVVKSFAQAALLTYIDPNVMQQAIRFLTTNQDKQTGEYKEKGVVYQKSMQTIKKTQDSIKHAVSFIVRILENRTLIAKNNQYELVIATYALTLVNAPISRTLLRQIERYSSREDGTKFWKLTDDAANMIQPYRHWIPPKVKVRALDIEITSYVLLIYNIRKDITNGVRVVKWLNKQKNPFGGFTSTQDTVIAIQAITGFAEKVFVEQFAVVTVKGNSWTGHTFTLDNTNSLVLHSVDAPRNIRQISIDCEGSGFLMLEVAVFFNVPEELRKPAFALNTTVLNDSVLGFRLKLCFSWLRGGNSTMGYMEIALPTGMEADMEYMDTTSTYGLFKKREASSDQLNLYFDWITTEEMCVEIDIDRISLVAKQKPVPARLSEYYKQIQANDICEMNKKHPVLLFLHISLKKGEATKKTIGPVRYRAVFFKGQIYVLDGTFRGQIYVLDGIFRGHIYVLDGKFSGQIYVFDGTFFSGQIYVLDGTFSEQINVFDGTLKVQNDIRRIENTQKNWEYLWNDPLGNRVKQYLKLQEEYGVVSGFLQLSPETHLGRWAIAMNQMVFSRGTIVQQGIFKMHLLSKKQTIRVTHEMTPSFKILVYYVRRYGEVFADAVTFSIKEIFRNKVTMKFDKKVVETGNPVILEVKADPGSLVNILAVAKSVLLLGMQMISQPTVYLRHCIHWLDKLACPPNKNDNRGVTEVLKELQRLTYKIASLKDWDPIGSVVDSGVDSNTVFSNVISVATNIKEKRKKCPAWGKHAMLANVETILKAKCKKIHPISSTQSDLEEDDCWLNAITGHTSDNVIQAIGAES